MMTLEFRTLPNDVRCIVLTGDLDNAGVVEVETRFFAHCAGTRVPVLVELSAVRFVGSVGIRMLVQAIKAVSSGGGRLLLLNPTRIVHSALDISGLGQCVAQGDEEEASAQLLQTGK